MNEKQMTLAVDWRGQTALVGWLASEKLNRCRAYWDGRQFWTRGGNIIPAPAWFKKGLPDVHLDGEIWAGRKGFRDASNAVRLGGKWFDLDFIQFAAFDAPQVAGTWAERISEARRAVKRAACAVAVEVERMTSPQRLVDYMLGLRRIGAEGGMFRNPDAIGYTTGRTETLLRWKFENLN